MEKIVTPTQPLCLVAKGEDVNKLKISFSSAKAITRLQCTNNIVFEFRMSKAKFTGGMALSQIRTDSAFEGIYCHCDRASCQAWVQRASNSSFA